MELGDIQVVDVEQGLKVVNCFTQGDYGSDGRVYADSRSIRLCLVRVVTGRDLLMSVGLEVDIYMPRIGCGLGGLNWGRSVLPLLESFDVDFTICDWG